ncbi:MAG: type II toxin-antitoxin system RelE family toxin [Candidatus Bathycorpusculaceae bacterium]
MKDRINELMANPYNAGKPLKGSFKIRNIWSSRIGNYRVLYAIFEDKQTVLVVRVIGENAFTEFKWVLRGKMLGYGEEEKLGRQKWLMLLYVDRSCEC